MSEREKSFDFKRSGRGGIRLFAVACLFALFAPIAAWARWAPIENAPLHIKRHDITVTIESDASWVLKGSLEIRVNTTQGRALMTAYKFPLGDDFENLKITSAEALEPTLTRVIDKNLIVLRDLDGKTPGGSSLFQVRRAYMIPFGDLGVGTIAKITYEIVSKKTRIPGVFTMTFDWGREYPELAGTLTFESTEQLYFDISKAARQNISFTQGRQGGVKVWKADLKSPIYVKPEGEQGGILSTVSVPRVQVSNRNTWTPLLDTLLTKYNALASDPLPPEFQKIVEQAKRFPGVNERINSVIELLNQTLTYSPHWNTSEGGMTPQKLSSLALLKRGDCKDFAFATVMILRALGYTADVTLVWRQSPTERLWIEETPTTPSLGLFNHAIVRVNDQGKMRYFDPTNPIPFGEGFLSDVGGSWSLTITRAGQAFERLPSETPMASRIKIQQNLDMRPDASVVGSGTVKVEGPLAAELKQVYTAQGPAQVEPYLRSLFGLALRSESVSPLIRISGQEKAGRTFDLSFSYLAPSVIHVLGTGENTYREFELSTPGLAGIPLLSAPDRATDVILSRNLTLEVETKVIGGEISDETNTSCLALTSFASLLRETKALPGSFTLSDHIQFKTDRIPAAQMKNPRFQSELRAYTGCLMRTRASIGPRPAFEKSPLGLAPLEVAVLKKPIANMSMADVKLLDEIMTPQLSALVHTKLWLVSREMLRRNQRSPQVMLEYANSLLQTGRVVLQNGPGPNDVTDGFLTDHVAEAAKLFGTVGPGEGKTAKFHRVHATMLLATDRPKEALIALQNAMAIEKNQARDAILAGQISLKLGDETKAESWLKFATTLQGSKSTRVNAIQNLAALRLRQRKVSEFIALYKQAIAEVPTNAWIYHDFAKLLQGVKMWDLSLEYSNKALSIMRFPDAEATLAETLIRKAESIYYTAPGIATIDPKVIDAAEKLALECLKYSRSEVLAYRIAGHATFLKAMNGDYGSLIATQSYFSKAVELGANDPWLVERYQMANQALEQSRPIAQVWNAYMAAKSRIPAAKNVQSPTPGAAPLPSTTRFPVPLAPVSKGSAPLAPAPAPAAPTK